MLFQLFIFLFVVTNLGARKPKVINSAGIMNRFLNLRPDVLILLDGDNIRGKSGFRWSKESLYCKVHQFVERAQLKNRVILLYDHGPQHYGHKIHGFTCLFGGSGRTADDVISKAVQWCSIRNCSTLVVTSDSG